MSEKEPSLFVALDVDDPREAEAIADSLSGSGVGFKLGPRLLLREGSALIRSIAKHGPVFVDCKHLDIPSTMEAAVATAFDAGARYTTVHALAGPEALAKMAKIEEQVNVRGGSGRSRVLVVTVLTSFAPNTLPFRLRGADIGELVEGLAKEARSQGVTSFVCSPHEAARLRNSIPDSFLVTPGIRPTGSSSQDQVRIETPARAAQAGASAMVVGRPVLESKNRHQTALAIMQEFLTHRNS